MTYYILSINELTFIESYYEQGHSNRCIARRLKRSPETVSRVVRKMQSGLGAPQIYAKYEENKKHCGRRRIELSRLDKAHIKSKLQLGWTPRNTPIEPWGCHWCSNTSQWLASL